MCGLIVDGRGSLGSRRPVGGRVVYLIVFGSIIAYSCYRYALQHLPVATLSLYVYANTVIAVGTLILGEPVNCGCSMGAAVVLWGRIGQRAGG